MEATKRVLKRLNPTTLVFAGPVLVCTGAVVLTLLLLYLRTQPESRLALETIAYFGTPALMGLMLGFSHLGHLASLRQMREQIVRRSPIVALTFPKRLNTLVIAHRPTADDPIFRGFRSVEDLFAFVYRSPEEPTFGQLLIQNADGTETRFVYDAALSPEENQAQLCEYLA